MIEVREASKSQAAEIARLIMTAMTDDCCLYFCEEGYGLEDLASGRACSRSAEQASLRRSRLLAAFCRMMTMLVEHENSQYSYRNTMVALDANRVVSVSYDGGRLHELRRAFIEAAKEHIGKDHSGMDDETQAGELYLDSLAVLPEYRRQGIARKLLLATKERANRMGLPCVGLLVDKDNPVGEALYTSVGFQYVNDNQWGGHPMKHLIL